MAKRFTATEKWGDRWYQQLSMADKLAWGYLCDNCDAAGVIDLNRPLADFVIGGAIDWDAFIKIADYRLRILPNGKLWLTGFVAFQYGELRDTNNLHRSVIALLKKHGIPSGDWQGMARGCQSPLVKVKEKEEVKETPEGGCKGETVEAPFDKFWSVVHRKVAKDQARREYDRAVRRLRIEDEVRDPHEFLCERMAAFAASPAAHPTDHTPIHPSTWLSHGRYNDDPSEWLRNGNRGSPENAAPTWTNADLLETPQ